MRTFETIREAVTPSKNPPTVPTDIPIIPDLGNSLKAVVAVGSLLVMSVDAVMAVDMLGIAVIIGMLVVVASDGMRVVGAVMVVGVRVVGAVMVVVFVGVNAVKLRVMVYLNWLNMQYCSVVGLCEHSKSNYCF